MNTVHEYKCPCCDGAIVFDSNSQKMECPFCGTEFDVETLASYDEVLNTDGESRMEWEESPGEQWREGETEGLRVYVCSSCAGEIVTEETVGATHCPYCGNPTVMMGQFSGDLKPDCIIPFKLDKKAAVEALMSHYKGKRLLPRIFKDQNHIEEVKGVYVPFWLYDAKADASMRYKATRTRFWSDSRYNYTETSYFSVLRQGSLSFDSVPVDGSSKMDDALMESLEPFDVSKAVDFQTAYLSGYFADKYDIDSIASAQRASERIKKSTADEFAKTVKGYATVIPESSSININKGSAKYALYPVWILNTEWQGKNYTFAMNGQTGKLVGNLPLDKTAYRNWLLGLTGAIGAVCFGLSLILWML